MAGKARRAVGCTFLGLLILAGIASFVGYNWLKNETAPMPSGPPFYVRYTQEQPFNTVVADLRNRGVIRNEEAFGWYARLKHAVSTLPIGTYQFHPGMSANQVLIAMKHPVSQMVRIPETNFSFRTARLLEKHDVLNAKEYDDLIKQPEQFKDAVTFPLPKDSLEGYLFPDTYDLPPLLGAHDTIVRQLEAFQSKVWPLLKDAKDRAHVLTVASMVELEAAVDKDRPLIAGVIENRLSKGMKLQIDATVLYGLGTWRRLTFADYRNTNSAYNTYLHDGLPPGPICSPSLKSVDAALHPAKHHYLYYVAMPNKYHLFAQTLHEHELNIAKHKAAIAHLKATEAEGSTHAAMASQIKIEKQELKIG